MSWTTFDSSGAQLERSFSDTPVGTITGYAGASAPNGWLLCNGATLSTTAYPELFAVIGYTYGGSGSSFILPNGDGDIIYAQSVSARIESVTPPQYVSSLPTAPINGQEIYYAASTASGVVWHLRYNGTSSSSYKWEFVGGSPLFSSNNNYPAAQNPGQTWADVTSAVTITAPVAGDYLVTFTGKHDATTQSINNFVIVNVTTSGLGVPNTNSALAGFGGLNFSTNTMRFGFERVNRLTGVAASATIKMQVYTFNVSTIVHHTSMSVLPVRVG